MCEENLRLFQGSEVIRNQGRHTTPCGYLFSLETGADSVAMDGLELTM